VQLCIEITLICFISQDTVGTTHRLLSQEGLVTKYSYCCTTECSVCIAKYNMKQLVVLSTNLIYPSHHNLGLKRRLLM